MKEKANVGASKIARSTLKRAGEELTFDTEAMNPDTFIDRVITGVEFKETKAYGELAIVTVDEVNEETGEPVQFHSFSEVIVDQLKYLDGKGKFPLIASVTTERGSGGRAYYKLE